MLFSVGYEYRHWGFGARGLYINTQGEIYQYHTGRDAVRWGPFPSDSIPYDSLMDLFHRNRKLSGVVDSDTLAAMAALVDASLGGELSRAIWLGNTGPAIKFQVYRLHTDTRTYERIMLRMFGSSKQMNKAPEARQLFNYLLPIAKAHWEGDILYEWPLPL
ncbi:MAG: hypothetical protein GF341_09475 [candidate division Zixibacteria bacterium]|nr:hypothetical protein [candidate division Zixibacteria bacterium]